MNNLKEMLELLRNYGDCQITHTISVNKEQIITVCYNKADGFFQVTHIPTLLTKEYLDMESVITAIDRVLNNNFEPSR
ncbi:hypothetical protein [Heyndrickxia acidicola]|uniref:Uncharacterized protein n=1 Tax=Heyndrickxia acidicola TaxID=209389 RepID=A0ABU6MNM9_9BACI|nr:hypothetical protein [Heyndrickxia acidicola]MED1206109.1 hypothetical protein [Heyndrickxia acidicola]